jgi:hypothetical protein
MTKAAALNTVGTSLNRRRFRCPAGERFCASAVNKGEKIAAPRLASGGLPLLLSIWMPYSL